MCRESIYTKGKNMSLKIDSLIGKNDVRAAVYLRMVKDFAVSDTINSAYWEEYCVKSGWTFTGIYCDECGKSDSRDKLLTACRKGEIDLILIRSIARLDPDLVTVLSIITELSGLHPSVGVYFTDVDLYSLEPRDYMLLMEICDMVEGTKYL